MLELEDIEAGYGSLAVLHGVSMSVAPGQVISLIGSNGAGKSTTIRAVAGVIRPRRGRIVLDGNDITKVAAEKRAALGIGQVPEGRQIFQGLSVLDNLMLGAFRKRKDRGEVLEEVFELFPILEERQRQSAGNLSGGQAQMLAIGRALMCRPTYLLMDEPSLGLAPILVTKMFETIERLAGTGLGILLAEQNATRTLAISNQGNVMERGRIVLSGTGDELRANDDVITTYLGGAAA
jgi:branched-chain amino acid transport system ATP-binding protein